jgi:hypothetical protein
VRNILVGSHAESTGGDALCTCQYIKLFLTFKFRYLFIFQRQCSSIRKLELGLQIGGRLLIANDHYDWRPIRYREQQLDNIY